MNWGIEPGDLPGWIGAFTGVAALCWNGVRSRRAAQAQNASRISATLRWFAQREVVTVDFVGAEPHTGYTVTVSCRTPRLLHCGAILDDGNDGLRMEIEKPQPIHVHMARVEGEPGRVRAMLSVHGHAASQPLKLTFRVSEGYGAREVARRTLPMRMT